MHSPKLHAVPTYPVGLGPAYQGWLHTLLARPLSWLYGTAAHLWPQLRRKLGFKTHQLPIPIISVGGLEVGGSGKTPVTAWLIGQLLAAGYKPGLATRGYGRRRRGLVGVRDAEVPLAELVAAVGDEAASLRLLYPTLPVAAASKRTQAAQWLLEQQCDCIVLDDGFSHHALQRDVDVVVLRGDNPLGNGQLLPQGTLREPPAALRRAHVLWLHHKNNTAAAADEAAQSVPQDLAPLAPQASIARSWQGPLQVWRVAQEVWTAPAGGDLANAAADNAALRLPAGRPIVAAAAIAWPHYFFAGLAEAGYPLLKSVSYPDHHAFSAADVSYLQRCAQAAGAQQVICTLKDAVKLGPLWRGAAQLCVAYAPLEVQAPAETLARITQRAFARNS